MFYLPILFLAGSALLCADDLQKARFTEVIRDVRVTKANATEMREAKVNDSFEVPEVIRTGMDSRAELEAPDKTIARIGSNTVFSFEGAKRTMNLQSGSVLFHSPKGMGGGIIKTAAATAAVTGTTIMVGATSNGGFKLMVLEGSSRVILPSGSNKVLKEGQMTFIMPGRNTLGPVIDFDLQRTAQGGDLLNGFDNKISSQEKIDKASDSQQEEIKKGKANSTETEILDAVNNQDIVILELDKNPEITQSSISSNSFPLLSSFLDSQIGTDLTLDTTDLSGKNLFLSTIAASGTYGGFTMDMKGSYGVVAGKNVSFSLTDYDFSRLGSLKDFGIFANGTMTFDGTTTKFSNSGDTMHFFAGGGITFNEGAALSFTSSEVNFEALGDIIHSSSESDLTIGKATGDLTKLTMESKNGKISLDYPVFNSAVTELRADQVNLNHLTMSSYTGKGAKVLNVYTTTGNWYYSGSGSIPTYSGSLNIYGEGDSTSSANGGAGTQVSTGAATYSIYSYQNSHEIESLTLFLAVVHRVYLCPRRAGESDGGIKSAS